MNKKTSVLIVVLVILILVIILGIIFILPLFQYKSPLPVATGNSASQSVPKTPLTPAQQLEQIQKNYPEIITGVINFLDTKNSYKTTITADDGKQYTLWPPQPESIYESFGAENGGKVQVNGKPLTGNMLSWALMKPI